MTLQPIWLENLKRHVFSERGRIHAYVLENYETILGLGDVTGDGGGITITIFESLECLCY